jgi:hypothetical protein
MKKTLREKIEHILKISEGQDDKILLAMLKSAVQEYSKETRA